MFEESDTGPKLPAVLGVLTLVDFIVFNASEVLILAEGLIRNAGLAIYPALANLLTFSDRVSGRDVIVPLRFLSCR